MLSDPWWREAAIYHIYPRSFADSNGDGIGDLRGITGHLDHLAWLGVDALWMGPVFRSPQVDNGYDISEYRDIDPLFGTLADLDELVAEAHRLGIRVLLDLVLNHSSTEHSWFAESRADPDGPFGDFYHWADPAPDGGLPNNWRSFFSIPAWTWDQERGQYYLNLFAPEQADLNWGNPAVREEMRGIANFWLERDVDGFRMDVINLISKAPGYPSIPPGGDPRGFYIDGPDALAWVREFRAGLHRPDEVLLVGETPGTTARTLRSWTAEEHRALNLVISFEHVSVDHGMGGKWDPRDLRPAELARVLREQQQALSGSSWPCLYAGNHDQPRAVSRFGDEGAYRHESAVAIAAVFLLLRGTPIVFQGDEIGMANFPLSGPAELRDVESINAYRDLLASGASPEEAFRRVALQARDHARTPMQWSPDYAAGFTAPGAEPWFPPNPDYPEWNVAVQRKRTDAGERAVLGVYRQLLALRRSHPAFLRGDCEVLDLGDESTVIAFRRRPGRADAAAGSGSILVMVNFSSQAASLPPLPETDDTQVLAQPLFATHPGTADGILQAWEVQVLHST